MLAEKGGERMANLAINIRKLRGNLGISQEELARRSGTTLATINRIETETQINPKLETIQKIAEGLGITVTKLLEDNSVKAG